VEFANLNEYNVTVTEILERVIKVTAKNEVDACEIVDNMGVCLNAEDFAGREVNAVALEKPLTQSKNEYIKSIEVVKNNVAAENAKKAEDKSNSKRGSSRD